MRVFQHCCRWCSFVGLFVLCIGGCDHAPIQSQPAASPQPVATTPATSEIASKPEVNQSRDKQRVPTGPVKIVNRETGNTIWPRSHLEIERAGDYYKIRCKDHYLAPVGLKPPLLRGVPDSKKPSLLWEMKPLDTGFWTLINHGSGKSLEMHKEKPPIRQAPFREGALANNGGLSRPSRR